MALSLSSNTDSRPSSHSRSERVAVIGGGWFGTHTALRLNEAGYEVTIYEKNDEIFRGISGDFGIRLHKGPHYPRSKRTRTDCLSGLKRFVQEYPELVIHHDRSIYALGKKDALGNPSKIDPLGFHACCHEAPQCKTIAASEFGDNIQSAYELNEPSIFLGSRLRSFFQKRLAERGVEVITGVEVTDISNDHTVRDSRNIATKYNHVVNATSFKGCLPDDVLTALPIKIQVSYQPCMALIYEDLNPQEKPFSFIVMDGWFPCIMPAKTDNEATYKDYVVTHGCYTILGSHSEPVDAELQLAEIDDAFVEHQLRPRILAEVHKYIPGFAQRFRYKGWKGHVLAKLKTRSEFRSAIVYEKSNVLYIVPGKINNVFEAADEVLRHLRNDDLMEDSGVKWARNGMIHRARFEIEAHPGMNENSTVNLQTFQNLLAAENGPRASEIYTQANGTDQNVKLFSPLRV